MTQEEKQMKERIKYLVDDAYAEEQTIVNLTSEQARLMEWLKINELFRDEIRITNFENYKGIDI